MRTTLDLPDPLFKEVKTSAVQQGVTLKELLATYIETGLRGTHLTANGPAPQENPHPLPVAWESDGAVTPARSNAELYAILEGEDIENSRRVSRQTESQP
jgi:hypothetical protein